MNNQVHDSYTYQFMSVKACIRMLVQQHVQANNKSNVYITGPM